MCTCIPEFVAKRLTLDGAVYEIRAYEIHQDILDEIGGCAPVHWVADVYDLDGDPVYADDRCYDTAGQALAEVRLTFALEYSYQD